MGKIINLIIIMKHLDFVFQLHLVITRNIKFHPMKTMLLRRNSSDENIRALKEVLEKLSWFSLSYQDNQ